MQALAEENRAVGNDPLVRLARVPEFAFRLARSALDAGRPVLISVPRRGYLPSLACAACRTHARGAGRATAHSPWPRTNRCRVGGATAWTWRRGAPPVARRGSVR